MQRAYHVIESQILGRPLEMLIFGQAGKPMLVFPSSAGRFFDYENFGMVEELRSFIAAGKLQVFCVDSIDAETWYSEGAPAARAERANAYDAAVLNEVLPFIQAQSEARGILVHGCSFGAYHSLNFYLRHPEAVDSCIALSGNYSIEFAVQGDYSGAVYFHDPLRYLPGLREPRVLDRLRENLLIICCGQGAWEDWLGEAREVSRLLWEKPVPHWLDLWGLDVTHDWSWWKKQIVYFIGRLDQAGLLEKRGRIGKAEVDAVLLGNNLIGHG